MKRTARASALLLCLALGLSSPVAFGQSPEKLEQAKAMFNAGAQAYSVGQFVAAIQAFEEAYKIAPRPAILFSLAQAERRQYVVDHDPKRLQRAVEGFRKYVAEVPQGGRRADAVQALSELEPQLEKAKTEGGAKIEAAPTAKVAARVMVTSPTVGAQVAVDGAAASEAPFIGEVKPGKHTVVVTAKGHDPEKREFQVVEGGLVALDLPLKERPALLSVRAPAGAEIHVDGRLVGVAPLGAPIPLSHGRHFVAVMKTGSLAWARDVDVVRGESKAIDPQLVTSGQRKAAWVFLGAGAAGILTGGAFTLVAVSKQSKAQAVLDEKSTHGITPDRLAVYDDNRDARDRFRNWSIVAFSAGGALAVTGVLLYALDRPTVPVPEAPNEKSPAPPPKPVTPEFAAAPLLGPGLVGGTFALAF